MAKTKGFAKNSPIDVLTQSSAGVDQEVAAPAEQTKNQELKEQEEKKRVGRPRSAGDVKKVVIAIPVDVLEKANVAKICYAGNMTKYINTLIERDLEENKDKYEQIALSVKNV